MARKLAKIQTDNASALASSLWNAFPPELLGRIFCHMDDRERLDHLSSFSMPIASAETHRVPDIG
jgi:hypothetical protein